MKKILTCLLTVLGLNSACGQQNFEDTDVQGFAVLAADTNVVVLDVRTASEFAGGHIRSAINIDYHQSDFVEKAKATLPLDKKIAVYCRSGRRSAGAATKLGEEGYKVVNLKGGIIAWNEAQFTLQDLDDLYATELVKAGTTAPGFTMKTPDGKIVRLSDFRGKTVVLDFWASWCPDCRKDAPEVVRLYETYHRHGVEFIGISMDTNVEAWKKAIGNYGITYPQVSELKKFKETDIAKAYGVKWIPSMVVVGPDGEIKLSTVMTDKLERYLKDHQ